MKIFATSQSKELAGSMAFGADTGEEGDAVLGIIPQFTLTEKHLTSNTVPTLFNGLQNEFICNKSALVISLRRKK